MLESIGPQKLGQMHGVMQSTLDIYSRVCNHVQVKIDVMTYFADAPVAQQRLKFLELCKLVLKCVIDHEAVGAITDTVAEGEVIRDVLGTPLNPPTLYIRRHAIVVDLRIGKRLSVYRNEPLSGHEVKRCRLDFIQHTLCSGFYKERLLQLTERCRVILCLRTRHDGS